MRIIYDCLGGDNAPDAIIDGAIKSYEKYNITPILCGKPDEIKEYLSSKNIENNFEILEANSKIENDEKPVVALRRKKDSSIVVGLNYLKDDKADAFISAGSTGAILAGGLFIVKKLDNVDRSPIATSIPTKSNPFLLLDAGANVDIDAKTLNQFATLGTIYLENVEGIENPKVGLLNNGSEEGKGNKLTLEAYNLLKENKNINFIGNVEPTTMPFGGVDIVVADGFHGNIFIKTYEATGAMFMSSIKEILGSIKDEEIVAKILPYIKEDGSRFASSSVGGAPLLGLNKPVFKAHGSSSTEDIVGATNQAIKYIKNNVTSIMDEKLKEI